MQPSQRAALGMIFLRYLIDGKLLIIYEQKYGTAHRHKLNE